MKNPYSIQAAAALSLLVGTMVAFSQAEIVVPRVDLIPGQEPANVDLDQAKQVFGAGVAVDNREDLDKMFTLISNDESLPYQIPTGATSIEVTFLNTTTVNRVNVVNLKVRGSAQVWASDLPAGAGSDSWRVVSKKVKLSDAGVTPIAFGTTSARALRVVVQASNKEQLGPIEAFGTETIYAITAVEGRPLPIQRQPTVREVTNQLSAASTLTDSRVTHVLGSNGKAEPNSMIDGDADTRVSFDGEGPYIAIIDMGRLEPIRRMTMLGSPGIGSVKVVPLMSLDDGNLAAALQQLGVGMPSGAAPDLLPYKLMPLLIGQTSADNRNNLGDMPESVTLPGNYFAQSNALNIPVNAYTGAINLNTTPMQYLVMQIIPNGNGPISISEFNAYTDPRERRWGAEPDRRQDGYQGFDYLDSLFRNTRIPLISK